MERHQLSVKSSECWGRHDTMAGTRQTGLRRETVRRGGRRELNRHCARGGSRTPTYGVPADAVRGCQCALTRVNAVKACRQLTPHTGRLCGVCDHAVTNNHVPFLIISVDCSLVAVEVGSSAPGPSAVGRATCPSDGRPRVTSLVKGPTRTPRHDWVARSRNPDGSKSRSHRFPDAHKWRRSRRRPAESEIGVLLDQIDDTAPNRQWLEVDSSRLALVDRT